MTIESSGVGNLAFDFRLINVSDAAVFYMPPITQEVMIWLRAYGGMLSAGNIVERVQVGGCAYDIFVAEKFGPSWQYISFIVANHFSGMARFDSKDFINILQSGTAQKMNNILYFPKLVVKLSSGLVRCS